MLSLSATGASPSQRMHGYRGWPGGQVELGATQICTHLEARGGQHTAWCLPCKLHGQADKGPDRSATAAAGDKPCLAAHPPQLNRVVYEIRSSPDLLFHNSPMGSTNLVHYLTLVHAAQHSPSLGLSSHSLIASRIISARQRHSHHCKHTHTHSAHSLNPHDRPNPQRSHPGHPPRGV